MKVFFLLTLEHRFGFYFCLSEERLVTSRWIVVVLTLSCSLGRVSLTQEAHGADLEAESLVGLPEVVEHDVDDGQLVDARRVDLQH